jgi:hypothetical protein
MADILQGYPQYNFSVLTFASSQNSSQNTFGLPTESVALIVLRFGSVANFLRLRNLGQV